MADGYSYLQGVDPQQASQTGMMSGTQGQYPGYAQPQMTVGQQAAMAQNAVPTSQGPAAVLRGNDTIQNFQRPEMSPELQYMFSPEGRATYDFNGKRYFGYQLKPLVDQWDSYWNKVNAAPVEPGGYSPTAGYGQTGINGFLNGYKDWHRFFTTGWENAPDWQKTLDYVQSTGFTPQNYQGPAANTWQGVPTQPAPQQFTRM